MAGRPKKYTSPEAMQADIDAYFQDMSDSGGHPTVTGLALALDMCRDSLINYGKDKEFFVTVKRAKLRIENYLETRLYENAVAGTIFNLKNNFGWKDSQHVEHGGEGGGPVQFVFQSVKSSAPGDS